jgi:hypothetical protein
MQYYRCTLRILVYINELLTDNSVCQHLVYEMLSLIANINCLFVC